MKLFDKSSGFQVGQIGMGAIHDKKKVLDRLNDVLSGKKPRVFVGDTEFMTADDGDGVFMHPKGGWEIMEKLTNEILKHRDGPIVEIGAGSSTEMFADIAMKYERKLYTCDIKMGGMFNVFDEPLFEDHICFIGKSKDFIKMFNENPAVVFIDGQHTYETVKMETDFFLSKLETGGVMFFHDMFPYLERLIHDDKGTKCSTAYKMRQELERNADIDVFTWPYTAQGVGLTMVMKHPPNKDREYWLKNGRVSE